MGEAVPWETELIPWSNTGKTRLEWLIILWAAYQHRSCWLVFKQKPIWSELSWHQARATLLPGAAPHRLCVLCPSSQPRLHLRPTHLRTEMNGILTSIMQKKYFLTSTSWPHKPWRKQPLFHHPLYDRLCDRCKENRWTVLPSEMLTKLSGRFWASALLLLQPAL